MPVFLIHIIPVDTTLPHIKRAEGENRTRSNSLTKRVHSHYATTARVQHLFFTSLKLAKQLENKCYYYSRIIITVYSRLASYSNKLTMVPEAGAAPAVSWTPHLQCGGFADSLYSGI